MPKVRFLNEILTVEAQKGQTIKEVAVASGIGLHRGMWTWANCRSHGLCGSCRVWVEPMTALSAKGLREKIRAKVKGSVRLACQARIEGDIEVRTLPGGLFDVQPNQEWAPDPRPSKWKERLEKADAGGDDEEEDGEAKPRKAAPAPVAAAAGSTPTTSAPSSPKS